VEDAASRAFQDVEGGGQLALVSEDDPGHDLGMMRQPGHRFFTEEPVKGR
jgi:hypothetical protein